MKVLLGLVVVATGNPVSDLTAGKVTAIGLALALAYGLLHLVKFLVVKLVELTKAWRENKLNGSAGAVGNPGPLTTPAGGLPVLGGGNPAGVGETSSVMADPTRAPLTIGEHHNICSARRAEVNSDLKAINTSLADTGDRVKKVESTLDKVQGDVVEIKTCVAVLKDRAERER